LRATEAVAAKFRDPQVTYLAEAVNEPSTEAPRPVILRGVELDFHADLSNAISWESARESDAKSLLPCSLFCSKSKDSSSLTSVEVNFIVKKFW